MRQAGAATAFHLSDDWFDAWTAAFAGGRGCTVAGLRLMADTARIGPIRYRRLRSATNAHSVSYDLPAPAPDPRALVTALEAGGRADVIRLDYLPEGSALAQAFARAAPAARHQPHALAPVADCRRSYDAWLGDRSKRSRTRLRREFRAVEAMGMRFALADRGDAIDPLLDEIFRVEQSGWKGRAGTAILDDPAAHAFYTDLARRAAAAGALRLALLRHEGRIVAFEYGVLGGRRLFLLKVGYDETLAHLSIGHVLAAWHIGRCCDDPGIDWYDKMGNGMTPAPYKLRFADRLDPRYRLTLYAPTWRGAMVRWHDDARTAARRLRATLRRRKAGP